MPKKRKRQHQAKQKGRLLEVSRLTEELKNLEQFSIGAVNRANHFQKELENIQEATRNGKLAWRS